MLRIKDIADKFDISPKVLRKYIHSGELVANKVNNVFFIEDSEFQRFTKEKYGNKGKTSKNNDDIHWTDISNEWKSPKKCKFTSVDLFCGAGGMAKGFEMAGFRQVCGLDIFDAACLTYRHNFKHPLVEGDIRNKSVKKQFIDIVRKQLNGEELTVLSGGFPCQGFSMSGKRLVLDDRNTLYKDMLDIIKELSPKFIVAENVKGLRSMLGGKIEAKIKSDIEALGYEVNIAVLNAADYYVPQKRERVIFIANRIKKKNYYPAPLLEKTSYITTRHAIEDLVNLKDDSDFNHIRTKHTEETKKRLNAVAEGDSLYENYKDAWKKCPWDAPSCTIKENHGGVNIHPKAPRVLTVRELARLQSFPDSFIFKGSKAQQLVQVGNAVPPLLAKAVALAVRKAII